MDSTTLQPEQLAVDVRGIARLLPFAIRTLRRMDAAGKLPRGFKVGGRKLWRVSDLRLWTEWGFPDREGFEARLRSITK
ncbi:MAG: hypothetical protein O7D91_08415 [Planctomycetota bacterium]|nr:hypothetical protein [Planctomycetota bacterium]